MLPAWHQRRRLPGWLLLGRLFCLLLLSGQARAQSAAPPPQPPPQAFFSAPEIGEVVLSPSSRHVALTAPGRDGRMVLMTADLTQRPWTFKTVARLSDWDVTSPRWLGDGRLLFQALDRLSGDWGGYTGLWVVAADGTDGRLLIDGEYAGFRQLLPGNRQVLSGDWRLHSIIDGPRGELLLVQNSWNSRQGRSAQQLARVQVDDLRPRFVAPDAPEGVVDWIVDERGQPRVLTRFHDGKWSAWQHGASGWQQLFEVGADGTWPWSPRFMLDGTLFVSSERAGQPGNQLMAIEIGADLTQAKAAVPVLAARGFDVGGSAMALRDGPAGPLIGWRYRLDTEQTLWGDPAMVRLQAGVDAALTGRVNLLNCPRAAASAHCLVQSLSDREASLWHVLEPASGRLSRLGSARPDLVGAATGRRSFHRIASRDGRELPLYLTRPVQGTSSPGPLVVLVHGGPAARSTLEWSGGGEAQFLASRGYTVVEPDFRGSTGYGMAHERAGWGQWGLAMQDDLMDALAWAGRQGHADARRACIMGASYGGYAALMAAVRDPDAFRCAIAWVAPTDLPEMVRHDLAERVRTDWDRATYSRRIGTPESLIAQSPLARLGALKIPVLAGFGVDDQRVPIVHARRLRDAAERLRLPIEVVEYAGEGHQWQQERTRLDFFQRAERLLQRSLNP